MKTKMSKGLALVITCALAIGMLLVNPFALKVNAETIEGYTWGSNIDGTWGDSVYFGLNTEPMGEEKATLLFHLTKGDDVRYALCVEPDNTAIPGATYALTTAGQIDDRVANILASVQGATDRNLIAAAQAAMWAIVNGAQVQTQYVTTETRTELVLVTEAVMGYEFYGTWVDGYYDYGTEELNNEHNRLKDGSETEYEHEEFELYEVTPAEYEEQEITETTTHDHPYKAQYEIFMAGGITRAALNVGGRDIAFADGEYVTGDAVLTSQRLITLIPYTYVEPTPTPTPTPTVAPTPAPAPTPTPEVLGADREGEVLGATRRVSTDDTNSRWLILFGLSALALTGVVLTKKKDQEVESVK
jgi:LPXTG-motif cell wall-anchored protein